MKQNIKFMKDIKPNDYFNLKYDVLVNDDSFQFASVMRMNDEEIARFLDCEVEEIIQVDFEDYE